MKKPPTISEIPEAERTPTVIALLEISQFQQEIIQQLRDEIARLKGEKPKPNIKPSSLENQSKDISKESNPDGKRPGSAKRKKKRDLPIHEEKIIAPEFIPEGSKKKEYREWVVQDLVIKPHNTRYRIEVWEAPDGSLIAGKLPNGNSGNHFGPTLRSFILYQYYQLRTTQPLLVEQLNELGIDISAGQVNNIITEGKDSFHAEKDEILRVGLEVSRHIHVDDTGARHRGKNGYCTHIGNELFAWFASTGSKSRINFLELLRAGAKDYFITSESFDYMESQKLSAEIRTRLRVFEDVRFEDKQRWEAALQGLQITDDRHQRIATESALIGSVIANGLNKDMVIISDDAGQFKVFLHALCWIHAERAIKKMVGFTAEQREAIKQARSDIWDYYADLKAYKREPTQVKKIELDKRFDEIFGAKTCFVSLNLALKRILQNKSELLLVLERPDIELHNNPSENDIRDYVTKRKVSGSTRSEPGRRCRDTFASLKKTCRKLNVSFWEFLIDRVTGKNNIPLLPELIRLRSQDIRA